MKANTGYKINVFRFGAMPEAEYEEGILRGAEDAPFEDYKSPVAQALYQALGTTVDDEEISLLRLPSGLAAVGLAVSGHPFAVALA